MNKIAMLWYNQAEEDFKSIKSLLKDKRYHGAVLFAQQSVEKLLKAYLIEIKGKMPLKTHRIEKLIEEAGLDLVEINNLDVIDLSKAYTWVRYPDLSRSHFPTSREAEELIEKATLLYLWIQKKFKNN